jgi:hypothetical protein
MQHIAVEKPNTNKPVAIEVDGEPQGVVVPDTAGYRFLAVRLGAFEVDGEVFESVEAARAAVSQAIGAGR